MFLSMSVFVRLLMVSHDEKMKDGLLEKMVKYSKHLVGCYSGG
jgi:hypothetical protein